MPPSDSKPRRWVVVLDGIAALAMVVASATFVWVLLSFRPPAPVISPRPVPGTSPPGLPTESVSLDGAFIRGNGKAKIAVIEYSDFECPYCAVFARDVLVPLIQRYVDTGKVLLAYRYLPLERLHPFAFKAAEAAECSARQGRFWDMHDALFRKQGQLTERLVDDLARTLRLNMPTFDRCLHMEAAAKVRQEAAVAAALGVKGTPTFFFGTVGAAGRVTVLKRQTGAIDFDAVTRILDDLLAQ